MVERRQLPGPDRLPDRCGGRPARIHDVGRAPDQRQGEADDLLDAAGKVYAAGTQRKLPPSTIYGFNGTFPGPRINAEYGKPALVRFSNQLDENPLNLDRQDFGSPEWATLVHLHNAHTAPESDGNPHYAMRYGPKARGFQPTQWVDQLYLNWPAGNDDREKQSFFWFHDHSMDHTGVQRVQGHGRRLPDLRSEERAGYG